MTIPTWATLISTAVTAVATAGLFYYAWQQVRLENRRQEREATPHLELIFRKAKPGEYPWVSASHLMLLNLSRDSVFVTEALASWRSLPAGFESAPGGRHAFVPQDVIRSGEAVRLVFPRAGAFTEARQNLLRVRFRYALTPGVEHYLAWEVEPIDGHDSMIRPVDPGDASKA